MQPIGALSDEEARGLQGLLFDLDDTLLTHGKLTREAYSALFDLQQSGLQLVAVTGRPIVWGKLLVRQWPIAAAVCETGALSVRQQGDGVAVYDPLPTGLRTHNRTRLLQLAAELGRRFPELPVASDADERTSDYTFDIVHVLRERPTLIDEAAEFAARHGARISRSSVHLHISFDTHDKASGTLALLSRELGYDCTAARQRFAYIGDSENDAPCFASFHTSIGVANLRGRHTVGPRFKTTAEQGLGFVEAASRLIAARR